jgi:hypothetical protein
MIGHRSPKPSENRPLRSSIDAFRARVKALEAQHGAAQAALRRELARLITPDHDEARHEEAVRVARREVAGVEVERRELAERIAGLETRLPTDEARAEAEARARAAGDDAEDLGGRFAAAWARLLAALGPAEEAAREVNALRAAYRAPAIRVEDLAARFGLDVPLPRRPEPAKGEARTVAALGLFISGTAYGGGPRDIVVRELDKARAADALKA